jgi:hypothetical protein
MEDRKEICSILDYLIENHGVAPLQGWFDLDLSKWKDEREASRYGYSSVSTQICKSLGFDYVSKWENGETGGYFDYTAVNGWGHFYSIQGYDELMEISYSKGLTLEGREYSLELNQNQLVLKSQGEPDLAFDLGALLKKLEADPNKKKEFPIEDLTLEASNARFLGKLYLTSLNGYKNSKGPLFNEPGGFLLLKRK